MNKYQEALDTQAYIVQELEQKNEVDFVWNLITSMEVNSTTHLLETTLQELVDKVPYYEELEDKATPKKPIEYQNNRLYWLNKCPSCECDIENDYCSHCGQALDWSKE